MTANLSAMRLGPLLFALWQSVGVRAENFDQTSGSFCVRSFQYESSTSVITGLNLNETSKNEDPIFCVSNSDPFQVNPVFESLGQYSDCGQVILEPIPIGFTDQDAEVCAVLNALAWNEIGTLECYYNIITQQFCGKIQEDSLDNFWCAPVDEAVSVRWPYAHPKSRRLLMKRGACDAPIEDPNLVEPEMETDAYLNGRNQYLNDLGCPLSNLQPASVDDTRQVTITMEQCFTHSRTTYTEDCYPQNATILEGGRVQYAEALKAQRQGDQVCFAYLEEFVFNGNQKECKEKCVHIGGEAAIALTTIYIGSAIKSTELRVKITDGASPSTIGSGTETNPAEGTPSTGNTDGFPTSGSYNSFGTWLMKHQFAIVVALVLLVAFDYN